MLNNYIFNVFLTIIWIYYNLSSFSVIWIPDCWPSRQYLLNSLIRVTYFLSRNHRLFFDHTLRKSIEDKIMWTVNELWFVQQMIFIVTIRGQISLHTAFINCSIWRQESKSKIIIPVRLITISKGKRFWMCFIRSNYLVM